MENLDWAGLSISIEGFLVAFGMVFVGALIQGSIGFGLNLVAVPFIAMYQPAALPASAILFAVPMTLGSALRERTHIDHSAVGWATLGRLPGVVLGAWIVSVLAPETLSLLIGGIVVLSVLMSVVTASIPIHGGSQATVGFLGGVLGTASSIGGPPMALLYQNEPGPVVRSTLGATFLVGTVLSIAALAVAGEVGAVHVSFALAMLPAVVLGLLVSRYAHGWVDGGWLRPCVLAFSAVSGIAVIARGAFGA